MVDHPLSAWVVDDDQSIRWVLEKALSRSGIDVDVFEDGVRLLGLNKSEHAAYVLVGFERQHHSIRSGRSRSSTASG